AANKQIVISSDRPPKAILTLEERLRSRFEGGLIADIQPPDLETRIAILRFKAESQPLSVPDEVIDLIAHRVLSNVRELEGALNRVVAYAKLMGKSLTLEVASAALRDLVPRRESLTLEQILETVANFYGLRVEDLKSRKRSKELVRPRQMAMYLMREEARASLPQIGEVLGGRDHTTVLYGHGKISDQIERDERLRRELLAIKERLYNPLAAESTL
ncbi:MAG TPA: chromosomal replication initiator protein DnaA, partial [Anaerolineae bacterium]|nr:chromosomal replication initiator protein DnaA [Anaerolineae bacterium]